MKILHTCLNVVDMDRSVGFYTGQLGLRLTSRREVKQNNAEIAFLNDESDSAIELTHWRDKKTLTEGDNFDHIAFAVEYLAAEIERFKARDVAIAMEPFSLQGSSTKIAFIKDPDGNWLELIQSGHE